MSVYLCVIDPDSGDDIDGVEISSSEFSEFRSYVAAALGGDVRTLIDFDTWDGRWTALEAQTLSIELTIVEHELKSTKIPISLRSKAERRARDRDGTQPQSMNDFFIDHDGQPLARSLRRLAEGCIRHQGQIRSQ